MKDEPLELEPHQWASDRAKPREPIFGTGLWPAVAWLVGATAMFAAIHLALR